MTKPLSTLALQTAARTVPAPQPKRERYIYAAPAVMVEEVENAIDLLVWKYDVDGTRPLESKRDELLALVMRSRRSAHATVQLGWAMAETAKATFAGRTWFFQEWMPAMKARHEEGTAMDENTPEGTSIKLGRVGRDAVIASLSPVFGANLSDDARKVVERAIIGKKGTALLTAKFFLAAIHGDEVINGVKAVEATDDTPATEAIPGWWDTMRAADRATQATTDADAESESDSEDEADSDEEAGSASA